MKRNKYLRIIHGMFSVALISMAVFTLQSCEVLKMLEQEQTSRPLTQAEIAQGLREALKVGINKSVEKTHTANGYFGNPRIKIPWPEEAIGAYNFIDNNLSALRPLLDEVVLQMNRGAEEASAKAIPIFTEAIANMTIHDAQNILLGPDDAATRYLNERTYSALHEAFKPDIHKALESVGAATLWTEITNVYNPVARLTPGIQPITTDLADYTTTKALDGLFLLVAEEELKIRENPAARINEILRRVFGSLDR